jgi:opacity protein-like surface antigen
MRTLTLALVAGLGLSSISAVQAADLDYGVLRGPDYDVVEPVVDWSGVYVGAHAGHSSANVDFKNVYQSLVRSVTAFSTAESDFGASGLMSPRFKTTQGGSFGAYAGYNYVFDNTVVGLEVDYTRFDRGTGTIDRIARFGTSSIGYMETVDLSGTASRKIEDYGTIRVRGGYAIDNFLPFVTAGLAIGRMQVAERAVIRHYGYDDVTYKANQALTSGSPAFVNSFGYTSFSQTNPAAGIPAAGRVVTNNKTKVVGGIALGAGLEFALTSNIILRAEYQYVMLNDFAANVKNVDGQEVNGGATGATSINTVRAGAAIKF